MFSSLTTQFPGGINNCATWQTMSEAGSPDPSFSQLWHDDFNNYNAGNFTLTLVGTGTQALTAAQGPHGILLGTTSAGAADANYMQLPVASFQLTPGKHAFFKTELALSDATLCDAYAGLIATSATPLAAADGLFFFKASGAATWVLRTIIGGVTVDYPLPAGCVAANAVFLEVGFHVDQQGNVEAFFNPTTGVNLPAVGGIRGRVASIPNSQALTQVLLAPSFGIRNGAAAIKTMAVDYLTVSVER